MTVNNNEARFNQSSDFFERVSSSNVDSIILRGTVLDIWEPAEGSVISRLCNRVVRFIKVLNGEFNDEKIAQKMVEAPKEMKPFPTVAIAVITHSERFKRFSAELDSKRLSRISVALKPIAILPQVIDLREPEIISNKKYAINEETLKYIAERKPGSGLATRIFLGVEDVVMDEQDWNDYLNRMFVYSPENKEENKKLVTSAALEAGKQPFVSSDLLLNTRKSLHRVSSRSLPAEVVKDLRKTAVEHMVTD